MQVQENFSTILISLQQEHLQLMEFAQRAGPQESAELRKRTEEYVRKVTPLFTRMMQIGEDNYAHRRNALASRGRHKAFTLTQQTVTEETFDSYVIQLKTIEQILDHIATLQRV
jgi:hypothetical protein